MHLSVDTAALARASLAMREASARLNTDAGALVPLLAEGAKREMAAATPRAPDDPFHPVHPHAADLWFTEDLGGGAWGVGNSAESEDGTTPYVPLLFTGTAPHLIDPLFAEALRFEAGGQAFFAKAVEHPGTQPNVPLVQALAEQVRHADEALMALGVVETTTLGHAVRGVI